MNLFESIATATRPEPTTAVSMQEKVIELINLYRSADLWSLISFVENFETYAKDVKWNRINIGASLKANLDSDNTLGKYYMDTILKLAEICNVDLKTATYNKIIY